MGDINPSEVFVLIPDRYGYSVVAIGDLEARLTDDDLDEDLEEAIGNAAIDSCSAGGVLEKLAKIQALNATGDADAYWSGP